MVRKIGVYRQNCDVHHCYAARQVGVAERKHNLGIRTKL